MDNNNIERERRPDGPSSPHRCDEEKAGDRLKMILVERAIYMQFKLEVVPDPSPGRDVDFNVRYLATEGEHSPITLESTQNIILATRGMKAAPFVRGPW